MFSLTERNPERIFTFMKKKVKSKNNTECLVLQQGMIEACHPGSESGTTRLLPRSFTQHQASVALSCAWEPLCRILIFFFFNPFINSYLYFIIILCSILPPFISDFIGVFSFQVFRSWAKPVCILPPFSHYLDA